MKKKQGAVRRAGRIHREATEGHGVASDGGIGSGLVREVVMEAHIRDLHKELEAG